MTSHITIRELTTGPGGTEWTWTGVCNRDACTRWPYGPPWKEGTREEVEAWAKAHARTHAVARCSCGRFVARGGRCSLEIKCYRDGSFVGWEHY